MPFDKLFEPVRIGRLNIRNRIVMPSMGNNYADAEGHVTDQLLGYYEARAKGGAGLIIIESTSVVFPLGRATWHLPSIHDDNCIPGFTTLAEALHRHGAKCAVQLQHAGSRHKKKWFGLQPVAPSAIQAPGFDMPREMTRQEIKELIVAYGEAGQRVKKAGFDAVELHASNGYLIHQFMSPFWNKRHDEYGGSLANRARFLVQVIESIKDKVGQGFPVWARIHASEELVTSEGIFLDEAQEIARMLEAAGVDAVSVSGDPPIGMMHMNLTPGYMMPWFEGIKKVVNVPVLAVGMISPELGNKILEDKKADLIIMGRPLTADPELPNKLLSGRLDEIRPCLRCGECNQYSVNDAPLTCTVNVAVGREKEYECIPAPQKKKRVLVVGAGPAGMEAALVAAERGHQVSIFEKGHRFGGQVLYAILPPDKEPLKKLISYMVTRLRKLNVDIHLGEEVTSTMIAALAPDAVVLATGVIHPPSPIPGSQKSIVNLPEDVLSGKKKVKNRVAVIGGGLVGLETADFLAHLGRKVTILEMLPKVGLSVPDRMRPFFMKALADKEVDILTGVKIEEITDTGLVYSDKEGKKTALEVDNVVLATGSKPNNELYNALKGKVPELYTAGDCVEPRKIFDAIHEGAKAGYTI